jgi:hypothetical protein
MMDADKSADILPKNICTARWASASGDAAHSSNLLATV